MIIDAHVHVFPPELIASREALCPRDIWFERLYADPGSRMVSCDDLLQEMDEAGVDAAVAFGFAFDDVGLCRACNDYVLDAWRAHPQRIIPFAVTQPVSDAGVREARRCLESGARGIGELMPDGQGFALDDVTRLGPFMELAAQHTAPVMSHVNELVGHHYPGKGVHGPDEAFAGAQSFPDNTFVFPHWGGGLPFFELMPRARPVLANVYYDTSASLFLYDDAIMPHVLRWALPKVLYGTDYPLIRMARFLRRARRAVSDEEHLGAFLGGNAARLFGLVDMPSGGMQ